MSNTTQLSSNERCKRSRLDSDLDWKIESDLDWLVSINKTINLPVKNPNNANASYPLDIPVFKWLNAS